MICPRVQQDQRSPQIGSKSTGIYAYKDGTLLTIMISRYTYKNLTWVDIESPSRDEIAHIMDEFSLPQLMTEEMMNSTLRSKVDLYENFIYVILHFPILQRTTGKPSEQEIDFIIGKDFIITIRYELVQTLHNFAKSFEVTSLLDRDKLTVHGGFLFVHMMRELYIDSLHELDEIMRTIKLIENTIFTNEEAGMVKKILHTSRKLLDFKQALRFHRDILHSYEASSEKFFGPDYRYYASMIVAEFNKVNSLLEGLREMLAELQSTNDSLLSSRSNEVMRALTIMTFILTPFTITTSIFTMNVANEKLIFIKNIGDFWFVVAVMTLMALVMFIFFRYRKWL